MDLTPKAPPPLEVGCRGRYVLAVLADILPPRRILLGLDAAGKDTVLDAFAALFAEDDEQLDAGEVRAVLAAREAMFTTGIGNGIAIPHGRVEGLPELRAALATQPAGVDFEAIDGEPVRLFVAILAPREKPSQHLRMLAEVSRLLRHEATRKALIAARSVDAAVDVLRREAA